MYTDEQYAVLASFNPGNVHVFKQDRNLDDIVHFLDSEKLIEPYGDIPENYWIITQRGKAILHRRAVALAESKKQAENIDAQSAKEIRDKKRDYAFQALLVLAAWALGAVSCNTNVLSSFFKQ